MPTPKTAPAPHTEAPQAPRPQTPTDGQRIDGRMAEFHWSSYPGADAYRLQISRSEEFDTLHVDFTVRATTVTELSGLLPIDGSTWYWRVRAEDQGSEWSVPATFVAGRSAEDTERPAESAAAEATASAKGKTTEAEAPAEVPFHTARTSGGWALTVGLGMVITFVITLFFIASAV